MCKELKIGIILEDNIISNWKIKTIDRLQNQDFIELGFIYLTFKKQKALLNFLPVLFLIKLLYKIVIKIENTFFSEIGPNAFSKSEINLSLIKKRKTLSSLEDLVKHTKSYNYDILINFSTHKFDADLIQIPKFGVWEILSGNNTLSNCFIGFREVFLRESTHKISLQKLEIDKKPNKILYQSFSQTHKFNILRNNNLAFWKAPEMIIRTVKNLQDYNYVSNQYTATNHIIDNLAIVLLLKLFLQLPFRYFQYFISLIKKRFVFNQWILMYQFSENRNNNFSFDSFKKIVPPKDRLWADPFVIEKQGKYHVFIEELIFKDGKGFISHLTIDKKGNYTNPKKIIENKYHMSYPFLIEDNGTLYMIPETNQNKTIEIYKCVDFPYKWELEMNLMENVEAVDTTIHYKDSKYWMFTNIKKNEGIAYEDELYIFSSNSLLSKDWVSHPKNPVVSDVRIARPAGNIFKMSNALFRPSQNSTYHYGYGLNMFEIIKLNKDEYEERLIKAIIPNWDNKIVSTHTFNQETNFSIIDAELRRKKFNFK